MINNSILNWRRAYQYFPIILWSFRYFGGLSGNSGLSGKSRDRDKDERKQVRIKGQFYFRLIYHVILQFYQCKTCFWTERWFTLDKTELIVLKTVHFLSLLLIFGVHRFEFVYLDSLVFGSSKNSLQLGTSHKAEHLRSFQLCLPAKGFYIFQQHLSMFSLFSWNSQVLQSAISDLLITFVVALDLIYWQYLVCKIHLHIFRSKTSNSFCKIIRAFFSESSKKQISQLMEFCCYFQDD